MQFKVVVIGVGAIANIIAQALGDLPQAKLVAGACRTESKGRQFAERFSCQWYADADTMLARERPDVAIVCTPSGAHLDAAKICAAHRVHILCEKPLEITGQRCRQMIQVADDAGIRLGGIFPQRFNPVNRLLYDTARAGRFGNLSMVAGAVPWWRDDAYYAGNRWQGKYALDGGGALMNQSVHTVDLVQWIAGATMPGLRPDQNPVVEVFAYTAKRGHDPSLIEVEDTAVVSLRFASGALGQLYGTTSMWPGSLRRLQVGGRDGTAEAIEDELTIFRFREQRPEDERTLAEFHKHTAHAGGSSDPMALDYRHHMRNIADFLDALAANRPPVLTGVEATKSVDIVEACYESARTGRPVRVAQPGAAPEA